MAPTERFSRRQVLSALGSGVGGALAGCTSESESESPETDSDSEPITDWPTVGHDRSNTRYSPKGEAPVSAPDVTWEIPIETPVRQPVVADGRVYIPDRNTLRVHDAASGNRLWTYSADTGNSQSIAPPTVTDGVVYLGHSVGQESVVALDVEAGERKWTFGRNQSGSVTGTPTLGAENRSLYVGTSNERVYCLDAETGDERWHRDVFGPVVASLAVQPPLIVAVTGTGEVYAFEENGDALWRTSLAEAIECPPTISGRLVVVANHDSHVYGLDAVTGEIEWSQYVDRLYQGGLVATGSSVYATSGRRVVALGKTYGKNQWSIKFDEFISCAPMVVDETLYVGGAGVTALKSDGGFGVADVRFGATRWTVDAGTHVGPGMAASDGRIFAPVQTSDGEAALVALEERE